ncbi:MAG: hypothetical protein Q9159_003682 [Coniocarpon cinnabarinum]
MLLRVVSVAWGTLIALVLSVQGALQGTVFSPPPQRFFTLLTKKRNELWNLSSPLVLTDEHAAHHDFVQLSTGTVLHYLTTQPPPLSPSSTNKKKHLIVFLHGYPDSSLLWTKTMGFLLASKPELARNSVIVALDLPGYGGSDNLPEYNASQVMPSVVEFIHMMRLKYLSNGVNGKLILVSHDWGAVIAGRLAVEVPGIADQFILVNGFLMPFFLRNVSLRLKSAASHLMALDIGVAWKNIAPLIGQINKSFYIFLFTLPGVLGRCLIPLPFSAGQHNFMRTVAQLAVTGRGDGKIPKRTGLDPFTAEEKVATHLARSLGPGDDALLSVLETNAREKQGGVESYPRRAIERVRSRDGWANAETESVRYYREGLARGAWTMTPPMAELYGDVRPFDESREYEILKKPLTIIWGRKDAALDWRVMIDGVEEWSRGTVRVKWVEDCAHWVAVQEGTTGIAVIVEEIERALESQ